MQNRMPSRRRQSTAKKPSGKDNTTSVQGKAQDRAPRAPHARDESANSQAANEPSSRRVAEAAREDIERDVVDTGKGPVLDQTYDKAGEGSRTREKLSP